MSSSAESSSAAQPAPPPAAVLKGHRDTLRALVALPADHPRRSRLASGSSDGTIRLWDPVAGGEAKAVLRGHSGGVYALTCFHLPTGGLYMVSGAFDNTLRLWDPLAAEALAVLHGHTGTVEALESFVLHPRVTQCVASSSGTEVRIWSITAPPPGTAWGDSAVSALLVLPVAARVNAMTCAAPCSRSQRSATPSAADSARSGPISFAGVSA